MSKITEAKTILAALQLRIAQQTEMAALTLLVMAQLDHETPWTPWSDTKRKSLRIHDDMNKLPNRAKKFCRLHQHAENGT